MTSRDVFGNAVPEGPYYNLRYPIHLDRVICKLPQGGKAYSGSALLRKLPVELREDFEVERVRQTEALIKDGGLILKGEFKFAVWVTTTLPGQCVVVAQKGWYKAVCIGLYTSNICSVD